MGRIRRILTLYLLVSAVVAHLAVFAYAGWHYRKSGKNTADYLAELSQQIRVRTPSLNPVADLIDSVFFDSGLLVTTARRYPADLVIPLPAWRGQGANVLRTDTQPRFDSRGRALSPGDSELWQVAPQPRFKTIEVATTTALRAAVSNAAPGDHILLRAGTYRIDEPLVLTTVATARRPIWMSAAAAGEVVLEFGPEAHIVVSGAYWSLTDLVLRGDCSQRCDTAVELRGDGESLALRNLFVSGFDRLIGEDGRVREGSAFSVIEGITLVGGRLSSVPVQARLYGVREVPVRGGASSFLRLCPSGSATPQCDTNSLQDAFDRVAPGGVVLMRSGVYRQGGVAGKRGIHLIAEPGARLHGKAVHGKGAIVSNNDLIIEGLGCSDIKVPSGNGACVRQQRGDLRLIGVHFQRAQMGVLTGHSGGLVRIEDSYIHDSGRGGGGNLGHNIYVNSGELEFIRSWSIAARNAGHEIKSRASRTLISDSIVASANAVDSRLIDVPEGGELVIRNSVLSEGPRSENWELVGYGLESTAANRNPARNTITLTDNTIYFDRPAGSVLLNSSNAAHTEIVRNVLIGTTDHWPGNRVYRDRVAAGVADYPVLRRF